MTESQKAVLARFIFACCLLGLVVEGVTSRRTMGMLDVEQVIALRNLRLPVADAVLGFMPQLNERSIWASASLLEAILVLAGGMLLASKGRISRSALALGGAAYALLGFDALPRIATGIISALGGNPEAVPTPPISLVAIALDGMAFFDGGVMGLVEDAVRSVIDAAPLIGQAMTVVAAGVLLYAVWRPERAHGQGA